MQKSFAVVSVLLLALLAGCSRQPNAPTVVAQQPSLAVPAEVGQILNQYADLGESTPPTEAKSKSPFPPANAGEYDVYAVTFIWGRLANFPAPASLATDWSGKLWLNAEALVDVRCTIDFEPGQDSLVPLDFPGVAWTSQTTGDFDGLVLIVSVKRGNMYFAAPELTFETAPITIRIPVHQLEHWVAYYPVQNGEGVAVLARRIWHNECPGGALKGRWIKENNTGDRGRFEGLWLDWDGNITGVYAGQFWTNNDGTGEFSGWVSGYLTDQIIAELRGRWFYDDPRMCPLCGDDHGRFFGKVRFLNDSDVGVVRGEFGDLVSPVDQLALPMAGVWKIICPHAASSSTTVSAP